MAVATQMPVEELTVALAMHCKLFNLDRRAARHELDNTQRGHFDQSCAWVDSNANVLKLVKDDPKAIALGSYSLAEARGWFSRLLGLGKSRGVSAPADDELEKFAKDMRRRKQPRDAARAKRMAELSKLVDESLESA